MHPSPKSNWGGLAVNKTLVLDSCLDSFLVSL